MPKVANRFALGIFFSITFLLLLLVMIWLTGWFDASDTTPFVCYFNESVQGLSSGSDVRYRGVPVGKIRSIEVAEDGRLVEVIMDIDRDFPLSSDVAARVDFMGITGLRLINLRIAAPGEAEVPYLTFDPPYEVIPIIRSQLEVLDVGLERVIEILAEIDAKTINDRTVELLENLNALLDRETISGTLRHIEMVAADLDTMIRVYTELGRSLERLSTSLEESAPELAEDIHTLAVELANITGAVDAGLGQAEDVMFQAGLLIQELRLLIDQISSHSSEMLLVTPREDVWPD